MKSEAFILCLNLKIDALHKTASNYYGRHLIIVVAKFFFKALLEVPTKDFVAFFKSAGKKI
jgi:hypothetical protein